MTPRQQDFSTTLGRMTDCVLELYRQNRRRVRIDVYTLRGNGFTDDEILDHADQAIRQAREIYEGETRESGNG